MSVRQVGSTLHIEGNENLENLNIDWSMVDSVSRTHLATPSEIVEMYGNALTKKQLEHFQKHTGQIPLEELEEITEEELKLIGFYKDENSPYRTILFKSKLKVLLEKKDVWGYEEGQEPIITSELNAFEYNQTYRKVTDNRKYPARYGYNIQSVYDILDFINGKEFPKIFDKYNPGLGLYQQVREGNRVPYGGSRNAYEIWMNDVPNIFIPEPRTRSITIQTGSAGMEEFNRAMREDFERNRENLFTQSRLSDNPILNMEHVTPIQVDNEGGHFRWDIPWTGPVIVENVNQEDLVTLQQIQNLNG